MPESITHQTLKLQARQLLVSKGFSEDKIIIDKKWFEEKVNEHFQRFRVDVYASNGHEIVVECGNFPSWKTPYYFKHFGKENVIHLPYPPFFGRYTTKDVEQDTLTPLQQTQYLIDTYTSQIYNEFKDDPVFDFQEFTWGTKEIFDVENHRTYREINPDYGKKDEAKGKTIWMNFPSSKTLSKEEYKREIHWGMLYYGNNIFAITIIFSGREPCERFLSISDNTKVKIFEALKNLPKRFFIRDGFLFWNKSSLPPLDKEWNNPRTCQDLTWEYFEKILNNLENLIDMQKHGHKVGPCLDLAKGFFEPSEIPEAISSLRELYSLLLIPETIVDEIAERIKQLNNWVWYIEQPSRYVDLYKIYLNRFDDKLDAKEFKKACKKLRSDPEFEKYYATDEFGE